MEYPFDCISDFVFIESKLEKSDVILIPGGSNPQLMERAVDLYNKGFAKYILPSGGHNNKIQNYESEWEYLREIGIQLGVPENAILKEDKAKNTYENALLSFDVIKVNNISIKNVILVCKAYHSRRALLTYQSVFTKDIKFYVSTIIDNRGISKDNRFLDNESITIVMNEVVKIGRYFEHKISEMVNGR